MADPTIDHDLLYYDDEENEATQRRSRSRSRRGRRSRSSSHSDFGSRHGSSGEEDRESSRSRSDRSRSNSASTDSGCSEASVERRAKKKSRHPSPPVSRSPPGQDFGRSSIDELRDYVRKDIALQLEMLSSPISQKKLRAMVKAELGTRGLADANVPNSYTDPANGQHVCGCPCRFCVALEGSLTADQKTFIWKIRGLRNWVPLDGVRPDTLLLPGCIPESGLQGIPLAFCGSKTILKELEKAFATGVFLDARIHSGSSVNTAPNLSSRWVGGSRPAVEPTASARGAGPSGSRIRQEPPARPDVADRSVGFLSQGPRFWKRLEMKEEVEKNVTFTASDDALGAMEDLLAIGKPSLDKRLKKYVKDFATLPTHQFERFRTPKLPEKFSAVAKMNGTAQARENALMAVGTSLNYSLLGAVKLSDSIIPLDALVPEVQLRLATLDNLHAPVYIGPGEDREAAMARMQEGQLPFEDLRAGEKEEDHWLRARGEEFLAKTGVLRDIFRERTEDPTTHEADPVSREEYLEVCWRLVTLREYAKKAQAFHEELDTVTGRVVGAVNRLNAELAKLQDSFTNILYPALGLTRATIQFQRMSFFKDLLLPEFKQFVRSKAAKEATTDGSERPIMDYLIKDMKGICAEFTEHMRVKSKDHEIWAKKAEPKKDAKKQQGGRGGGGGGGSGGGAGRSRLRSPSKFIKKDKNRGNRGGGGGQSSSNRRKRSRDSSEESDHHDRDNHRGNNNGRKRSRRDSRDRDRDERSGNGGKKSSGGGGRSNKDSGKSKSSGKAKSSRGRQDRGESLSFSSFSLPANFDSFPENINASFWPRHNISSFVTKLGFDVSSLDWIVLLPEGGRTQRCVEAWKLITSSKWVLNTVEHGVTWSWKAGPPTRSFRARRGDLGDVQVLQDELSSLLKKGALVTREGLPPGSGETFIASYFAVPKKAEGKYRPIANLKPLNRNIANSKFKMESVKSVRKWIVKDSFMISLDLSDAYLSLAVARDRWRFLGLEFEDVDYFYCCLCFGLNAGPRIFTKVLKRVIQFFRSKLAIWVTFYLDDLLSQSRDPQKLVWQTEVMILILHLLGFRVNFEKSDLVPAQRVTYIGFEFDSVEMTVSLPLEKVAKIGGMVRGFLDKGFISVKDLQRLMGSLESTRPAVRTAPLHYRKTQALLVLATKRKWAMKKVLSISEGIKSELLWWVVKLPSHRSSPMRDPPAEISIWSDAATNEGCGWGGHSSLGDTVQGVWSEKEREMHINVLETLGAVNVVEALLPPDTVAAHYIDNTTAVAYVRNFGGTVSKGSCDRALQYWDVVLDRNSWVIPSHIAGKDNVMADFFSRHTIEHHEFGLIQSAFDKIVDKFFLPQFDLFASSKLHVTEKWASYCWTRDATAGDAFLMSQWPQESFIFPPFPLINEVVARLVKQEDLRFILVAPISSRSPPMWFPLLMDLVSKKPLKLGKISEICRLATGKPLKAPGELAAFVRL